MPCMAACSHCSNCVCGVVPLTRARRVAEGTHLIQVHHIHRHGFPSKDTLRTEHHSCRRAWRDACGARQDLQRIRDSRSRPPRGRLLHGRRLQPRQRATAFLARRRRRVCRVRTARSATRACPGARSGDTSSEREEAAARRRGSIR